MKVSAVDYQGKSFRVVGNGVGIVSEIPGRYAQSIFNQVFEFGVGVALLESVPLGNYAIVIEPIWDFMSKRSQQLIANPYYSLSQVFDQ